MWEGTNPGLGRTIFNAFIGTVLKSNPTKRHVQLSIALGPIKNLEVSALNEPQTVQALRYKEFSF